MTLHPQAAAHLRAAAGAPTVAESTVSEVRLALLGYCALQQVSVEMLVEHRFIPGPTADLPIRISRPDRESRQRPAVIVLHGSDWVAANLDQVEEPARRLAAETGFIVVTVNYQKAPEHPFPIPLDDCVATIEWVRAHAGVGGMLVPSDARAVERSGHHGIDVLDGAQRQLEEAGQERGTVLVGQRDGLFRREGVPP